MEKAIDKILENYENCGRDSLIPLLQEIQEKEGYLSEVAIVKTGLKLKIPTSKIYGVATFIINSGLNLSENTILWYVVEPPVMCSDQPRYCRNWNLF